MTTIDELFVNRERELEGLERAWGTPGAQLVTVWGRRRVGKTTLLSRFAHGKPGLFLYGQSVTEETTLRDLASLCAETFGDEFLREAPFQTWPAFLNYLAGKATEERLLFVIDEFPYLVGASPGLATVFQRWWDQTASRSPLAMIIAGSAFSLMKELAGPRGALHGRRTAHLEVRPFDYYDAAAFYPRFSAMERVRAYAALGGMPAYARFWQGLGSFQEAVLQTCFRPQHFLFTEGEELVRTEFHQEMVYMSLLRAAAAGERRPSDLARAVGRGGVAEIAEQLRRLVEAGFLHREVPITEEDRPRSRRVQYRLADPYLRFWHAFVAPYRSLFVLGEGESLWRNRLKGEFEMFLSRTAWEEVVRQYLWRLRAVRSDLEFARLGRWWDDRQEIDLVGIRDGEVVLVGECKWTGRQVTADVLRGLRRKAAPLPLSANPWWVLASRSGFSSDLHQMSGTARLLLIEPKNLFEIPYP